VDPFRAPAAPTRPCPRCGIGLGTRAVIDVRLDECSDCGGVFVPADLVPRLLDPLDLGLEIVETFPPGEPEVETPVRYLRCPRCATMMNRHLLVRGSNVVVDWCKTHGVWFDAHELRRLAELAASGRQVVHPEDVPAWQRVQLEREAAARRAANAMLTPPIERPTLLQRIAEVLFGVLP
jgi:Zn-finger nucleic acid-binding protein